MVVVEAKFGLTPALIIDYLALMGDKVDNIPGVPGVGEKTAIGLLQGIGGGLDTLYADLERVKTLSFRGAKTLPKKLEEHRDQAFLSYQLATIKTDCELPVGLDDLDIAQPDQQQLAELYREMEFKQWLNELLNGQDEAVEAAVEQPNATPITASPSAQRQDRVMTTQEDFDALLARLEKATQFCVDLETTSLNYMDAEIVGIGLALDANEAFYIPLAHDYLDAPAQLDRKAVLSALQPLLEHPEKIKIGQNLKYDMSVLASAGIQLAGPLADTMLASYVLNATATRHDMDSLALKYLGEATTSFEDIAGKGAKQLTFNQIALEQAAPYACEDVDITLRLQHTLRPLVEAEGQLAQVLDTLELPLVPVLSRIERNGVALDAERLHTHSQQLEQRIHALEKQAFELAGREFNLGSPKQLGEILFEEQKIPVLKKTPKGAPSTAEAVLEELALDYPLPKVIMEHRGLAKLKSTYTDKLPRLINPGTGRVHTSYHQAVTATGRLSSSDPNLQNIPIRTEEGRKIRQAFIARPGYRIVAADYSQIELRIMAHLSEDKGLLAAFAEGKDIHSATAAEVFGTALEKVSDDQRRSAKAINFGLIYGMSAWGLSRQLHIERGQAQTYIDRYFDRYPGVARYMERIRSQAAEDGFVETVLGRRLYLPEIHSQNRNRRQGAERTAINAPMQGTAADIIKRAMIEVDAWLTEGEFDALMVMQVHDELVFEVAESQVEAFIPQIEKRMQAAASLSVPLTVEAESGANWDEAH